MKNKAYLSWRLFIFLIAIAIIGFIIILWGSVLAFSQENYGIVLVLFFLYGASVYCFYHFIYKPYQETTKVLNLFVEGYLFQGILELRSPLTKEVQAVITKYNELLNTKELLSSTKKQAEYLALQNQINPHFLYNTLEGIRSEALCAGVEGVAEMTEALATFFRYTISNVEHLVSLEEELSNIENYFIIQQYRFGDRISLSIDFPEEESADAYRLPKLTLQPIVENAIYHGLERKVEKGRLLIKIEITLDRLIIIISDDGFGIEAKKLRELNEKLRATSLEDMQLDKAKRGGIAITNVNNRIKLLFGDAYGIHLFSRLKAGTDVEITLPLVRE